MKILLPEFEKAHILVAGDVMLDRYWVGATQRISPEAPVPIVKVDDTDDRPGGAANVAFNIAALNAQVCLAGITGQDDASTLIQNKVEDLGVKTAFTHSTHLPTIMKLRVLSSGQQLLRLDFEKKFDKQDALKLTHQCIEQLASYQVLVLSDYAKGTLAEPQALIQAAKALSIPVIVDPKGLDIDRYRGATLLTPNIAEFTAMVGAIQSEAQLHEKALVLIEQLELQALLITRSEKGMTLIQKGEAPLHLPTFAQEVFDVTGAGDTVVATLAAALATGTSLADSCRLANLAAGIVVGKVGTSTATQVELAEMLSHQSEDLSSGVITEDALECMIRAAQGRGEKIVMTNGCFDLLHAGHVSYLKQAKALGHRLVVAVNTDQSVKALKGKTRPVNPCMRRMSVLAGLESVDWVVSFSELTPQRLITRMQPDVLVKGGDYQLDDIVGASEVLAGGGEVKVLDFEDHCSTSAMIETIIEQGM